METQNNYKRTVAGSVGAGMGAIFNGSGRTYYILEHKTGSKYHAAGDSQKIIIDQIELGRAATCQVRFDESFENVSRKHAAIVRDGNNWQLIHLSSTNPTLVNGRPIQGTYYLQSGDEIQLAVGGPRLGFIQPQGRQALTSSIKLTERMNLFRQQALRPYRRAIWALSCLLFLAIVGMGTWNYMQHQEIKEQEAKLVSLVDENKKLDTEIANLMAQVKDNPENKELKAQLEELKNRKQQVITQYRTIIQKVPEPASIPAIEDDEDSPRQTAQNKTDDGKGGPDDIIDIDDYKVGDSPAIAGAKTDIQAYYDDIYTIKIENIKVERDGKSADPGIATSNLVVGTGFVSEGKFITARSNIQPWVYRKHINDSWRDELAGYVANGFKVIINFAAYSTRGTNNRLTFSSEQFNPAKLEAGDVQEQWTQTKEFYKKINLLGFDLTWKEYRHKTLTVTSYTSASHNVATIKLTSGGIPVDRATAGSLKGGENVTIAGYKGRSNQHSLGDADYFTSATSSVAKYFITLQSTTSSWGFLGSPAFYKEPDGTYAVVGVYVGNFGGESLLVPLNRVY